jgi:uncharacterized membrane protein YfcA
VDSGLARRTRARRRRLRDDRRRRRRLHPDADTGAVVDRRWRAYAIDLDAALKKTTVTVFALATLPGAIGGALLTSAVPRRTFDVVMGGFLLALAAWILLGGRSEVRVPRHRLRLGALYSAGVGFVSSFLGSGGGIVHVPLLVRALGFPTHVATATSHFVLAIMGGAGALTHALTGGFAHRHGVRRALALSAGVVVGAQAGAHVSLRLRDVVIQRLLAGALLVLSLQLLA